MLARKDRLEQQLKQIHTEVQVTAIRVRETKIYSTGKLVYYGNWLNLYF